MFIIKRQGHLDIRIVFLCAAPSRWYNAVMQDCI